VGRNILQDEEFTEDLLQIFEGLVKVGEEVHLDLLHVKIVPEELGDWTIQLVTVEQVTIDHSHSTTGDAFPKQVHGERVLIFLLCFYFLYFVCILWSTICLSPLIFLTLHSNILFICPLFTRKA
jgi:hypothetical protein